MARKPGKLKAEAQQAAVASSATSAAPAAKSSRVARKDGKVRVAIIGVGNCASSFVQGVHYYRDAQPADRIPGLMHVQLGDYHIRDIEFTAAFDVDVQ